MNSSCSISIQCADPTIRAIGAVLASLLMLLLVTGGIGNLFILIVVHCQKSLRPSTRLLFQVLALADGTALLVEGSRSFSILVWGREVDPRSHSRAACRFLTFLTVFPRSFSMWILALLNIERLLVSQFPFRFRAGSHTRRWAVVAILIIATVLCTFHGSICGTREYKYGRCRSKYPISFRAVLLLDLTIRQIIPGATMVICGMAIIAILHKQVHGFASSPGRDSVQSRASVATKMTLMASLVQLCLTLPNTVNLLIIALGPKRGRISLEKDLIFFGMRILELSAHGTNIYIYLFVNRPFCQTAKSILHCERYHEDNRQVDANLRADVNSQMSRTR